MTETESITWQRAAGPIDSAEVYPDPGANVFNHNTQKTERLRDPSTRISLVFVGPEIAGEGGMSPGRERLRQEVAASLTGLDSARQYATIARKVEQAKREVARAERTLSRAKLDLSEAMDGPLTGDKGLLSIAQAKEAEKNAEQTLDSLRLGTAELEQHAAKLEAKLDREFTALVATASLRVREALIAELEGQWAELTERINEKLTEMARRLIANQLLSVTTPSLVAQVADLLSPANLTPLFDKQEAPEPDEEVVESEESPSEPVRRRGNKR